MSESQKSKTEAIVTAIKKYIQQLDDASDGDELESLRDELSDIQESLDECIEQYED